MSRMILLLVSAFVSVTACSQQIQDGVRKVKVLNYPDCLELYNAHTSAILGHHVGGRVLQYSLNGREALYLDPKEALWQEKHSPDNPTVSAGRFDIGPEYLIPRRSELWSGRWKSEIIGPRSVRLTSPESESAGVQLVREFRLASDSSHLQCTQIIRNISRETKNWCHWSRTFAKHGGIAIVPLTPELSRLPNHYVMYRARGLVNFLPEDPNIRRNGKYLEITGPPAQPKLGMDSHAGWFAYQMPEGILFVKRYRTYPDRVYNDLASITISIWYPTADQIPACELEPIGPRFTIQPGEASAFTEHWWLLESSFSKSGKPDSNRIGRLVEKMTKSPDGGSEQK